MDLIFTNLKPIRGIGMGDNLNLEMCSLDNIRAKVILTELAPSTNKRCTLAILFMVALLIRASLCGVVTSSKSALMNIIGNGGMHCYLKKGAPSILIELI